MSTECTRFEFETVGVTSLLGEMKRVKTELSSTLGFTTQLINTLTILGLPKELRETVRALQKIAFAANMAAAALSAVQAAMTGDITAAIRAGMYSVNAAMTLGVMMME